MRLIDDNQIKRRVLYCKFYQKRLYYGGGRKCLTLNQLCLCILSFFPFVFYFSVYYKFLKKKARLKDCYGIDNYYYNHKKAHASKVLI